MKPQPITTYNPSFGIYKGSKKTPYGDYIWGNYKGYKIEVFDATEKHNQKLYYVRNSQTFKWIKSKLRYFQNGIKKIIRSNAKCLNG